MAGLAAMAAALIFRRRRRPARWPAPRRRCGGRGDVGLGSQGGLFVGDALVDLVAHLLWHADGAGPEQLLDDQA